MAELSIITEPFKPDGHSSSTKSRPIKYPETIYYTESDFSRKHIKRNTSQGLLFDKNTAKSLKSFASSLLLPIKGLTSHWKTETPDDEALKLTESLSGFINQSDRKNIPITEQELIEKQVEEINILHE